MVVAFQSALHWQVNGAVDAMEGERSELQSEIESYQRQLSAALDDLEAEKIKSQGLEKELESNPKVSGVSCQMLTSLVRIKPTIFVRIIFAIRHVPSYLCYFADEL